MASDGSGAYLVFCLLPLGLAAGQPNPPGRPFLVEFSVALGICRAVDSALCSSHWWRDSRSSPHRSASTRCCDSTARSPTSRWRSSLGHPVLLFIADTEYLKLLNLWTAPWRARFAVTSVVALVVLVVLSVWRQRMRIRYESWQRWHGIIAVMVVLCALLHASLVGYYVTGVVRHIVYDGYIGMPDRPAGLDPHRQPLLRLRQPWRVVRGDPERGNASTLVIEPVGHAGFRVRSRPVRLDRRQPVAVLDHPAPVLVLLDGRDRPGASVAMTIKSAGDFTATIPSSLPAPSLCRRPARRVLDGS